MNFKPCKPDWYYHLIEIDNLEEIKVEFFNLLKAYSANKSFFLQLRRDEISKNVPSFSNYLKRVNLFDKWGMTALSIISSESAFSIHVDSTNCTKRFAALNIPIANYSNSFTFWTNSDIVKEKSLDGRSLVPWDLDKDYVDEAEYGVYVCKNNGKTLATLETNRPYLMNVSIPHGVKNFNPTPRYLVSTRFSPELTEGDLIQLGIREPFKQTA